MKPTHKTQIIIIALLALVSLMISPVMAETLTGELVADYFIPASYTEWINSNGPVNLTYLKVMDIEKTYGWSVLVMFNTHAIRDSFGTGAVGATTPVTMRLDNIFGTILGTGDIGYQRVFNTASPPVEQPGGFFYIDVISWDPVGLTGDKVVYLDYNRAAVNNFKIVYHQYTACTDRSGMMYFDEVNTPGTCALGDYIYNRAGSAKSQYTATKPSGIGIAGTLNKTGTDGVVYNSQGFIFDAAGNVLASESVLSNASFYFTTNATQIKIGMFDSAGVFTNSSLLFTTAGPIVTPTPVPTIAPGYIRTEIITMDIYNNVVTGSNIDIRDNEASVWINSTNDADGLSYIDTLPYHTLDVYGSYTQIANQYQSHNLIGISTGYDGGIRFWLVLYPYNAEIGVGDTDLYVTVLGNPGLVPISNALVRIDIPNNASLVGYTSGSGVQRFTVPNNTVLHVTGSKSGYQSQTTVMNSGSGTTAFANIVLDRLTVTTAPTSTIPPGGVTIAIPVDTRDNRAKGESAIKILYDNGESIVMICVLVTILGLLGIKLGK